jgi:hypothetical protein
MNSHRISPLFATGALERVGADISAAIPNFWLVVLTDGADTSSKTSLKDACELLAKIDAELGRLNLIKILLIGVELQGNALRNMEQLARAGGSSAAYENLRDAQSIRSKFHDISLQIRASAAAGSSRAATGPPPKTHAAQSGSHRELDVVALAWEGFRAAAAEQPQAAASRPPAAAAASTARTADARGVAARPPAAAATPVGPIAELRGVIPAVAAATPPPEAYLPAVFAAEEASPSLADLSEVPCASMAPDQVQAQATATRGSRAAAFVRASAFARVCSRAAAIVGLLFFCCVCECARVSRAVRVRQRRMHTGSRRHACTRVCA